MLKRRFSQPIILVLCFFLLLSSISVSHLFAYQGTTCPGFLPSRLVVGEGGQVGITGTANNIRDSASKNGAKSGEIPPGGSFLVLEGPICADGLAWWRVDYGGLVGWTAEGSGDEYWLEPTGPLPTQAATVTPLATSTPESPGGAACPGFLPSRLIVGERGRVVPGPANTLRADATSDSQKLGEIPGGATFLVMEGPICAGGLAWWRVDYGGTVGWTAEGSDDEYWLEPAGPLPTLAPTLTPTITLTPSATFTPRPTATLIPEAAPVTLISDLQRLVSAPLPENLPPITTANIGQLRPLSIIGGGQIRDIAWSPDGHTVAVLTSLGVWLYDLDNPDTPGHLLELPSVPVLSMAFSPDGKTLAVGGQAIAGSRVPTLQIFDLQSSEHPVVVTCGCTEASFTQLAYSPNGKYLASGVTALGNLNLTVRVWDPATGTEFLDFPQHVTEIATLAFSPDSKQLAFIDEFDFSLVHVWDVELRESQITYESFGGMYDVTFSGDGSKLLAAGGGGSNSQPGVLRVWDVTTAQRLTSPTFETDVNHIVAQPGGSLAATAVGGGQKIWLWNLESEALYAEVDVTPGVNAMRFSPDGSTLALGDRVGKVWLWDVETRESQVVLDIGQSSTLADLSHDAALLAVAPLGGGDIQIIDLATGEEINRLELGIAQTIDFSDDANTVYYNGYFDRLTYAWNLETGEVTRAEHTYPSGQRDEPLYELARVLVGSSAPLGSYAATAVPGTSLIAIKVNADVQFWDTDTRLPLASYRHLGDVLGFSQDGTIMMTRTPGAIWLWGITSE